jgi:DNA polymerase III delta prime subunit
MSFIHKYQPMYFNDYDNDEIIGLLEKMIEMDNLNILFYGEASCGKTTLLNSLIREYYTEKEPTTSGEKENKEPTISGIVEKNILRINNLKEQGINYFKNDVKTFCQTSSVIKNKKKIILIDDLDTMNEQCQQVFCNFIDKYSHSVHFISSCCNIQKVNDSLQSRFLIMKIYPLNKDKILNLIHKIRINENIDIEQDVIDFIIHISNGTIKILINYMEKFKLIDEKITMSLALEICSNISILMFEEYTNYVKEKNIDKSIKLIYKIYDKGYSVMDILDNYFMFIKNTNLYSEDDKYKIIPIICKYITIFNNIHEDEIELTLFTNNLINLF